MRLEQIHIEWPAKVRTMLVIYTWPDGREEIRYQRPAASDDARKFANEIDELRRVANVGGHDSPYSYRFVQ